MLHESVKMASSAMVYACASMRLPMNAQNFVSIDIQLFYVAYGTMVALTRLSKIPQPLTILLFEQNRPVSESMSRQCQIPNNDPVCRHVYHITNER